MSPLVRFQHMGFRTNPFITLTAEEWLALSVWPMAVAPLAQQAGPIQLLGSEGAGKTTSLHLLIDQWQQQGLAPTYEHLPEEDPHLKTDLTQVGFLVLDEAQRLSWWARWRVGRWMRAGGRLVCASHEDMRRWWGAMTTVNVDESHTAAHWAAVFNARLAHFALHQPPPYILSAERTAELYGRFAPNLRAAEWFLYEEWEAMSMGRGMGDWGRW